MTRLRALALLSTVALIALAAGCMSNVSGDKSALVNERGTAEPRCLDDFRQVEGQGQACPLEHDLWKIKLDDRSTVVTHGPDSEEAVASLEGVPQKGYYRAPVCTQQNPHGNYHAVAIIAWPSDMTPNLTAADLRLKIYEANWLFYLEATESGSPGADLVFACDSNGFVRVDMVGPLPFTKAQSTFAGIISALQARGYNKANEKYVVWFTYEVPPPPPLSFTLCGEATGQIISDTTPTDANANNLGPRYALSYNCDSILHEWAHTLGAVQTAAPHATYRWHCWQENDVMCYDDNGIPGGAKIVTDCPGTGSRFDCKFDDYFDAAIGTPQGGGAGSYLDTHWNLGGCYVRWIVNYAQSCQGPVTLGVKVDASLVSANVHLRWAPTGASAATQFLVYRDNLPIARQKGERDRELEFLDEDKLVPGEVYDYRIVGLDPEGEFDSNSNVESVTISD